MRSIEKTLWLGCCLALLAGCSADLPTGPSTAEGPAGKSTAVQATINNYIVQYDGRTVGDGETTFHYTVFGTGVEPQLIYFGLELPDCAPELGGYAPGEAVTIGVDPRTGIHGIRWDLPIQASDTQGRQFSVTFGGEVAEGTVRATVKSGYEAEVGDIPGPCAGAVVDEEFLIAGKVFVDADVDGLLGAAEAGIADVVLELLQDGQVVATARTDAMGTYGFAAAAGAYAVRVGGSDTDPFNAVIWSACIPTRELPFAVLVGPDSPGNNIGFTPLVEDIIADLEDGELLSAGRTVRFWKRELRMALDDSNDRRVYDRETLEGFVAEISSLYLDDIFGFTPGHELQEAWEILSRNDPLIALQRELLATEFNLVADRGLLDSAEPLLTVLVAWGEAVVLDNQPAAAAGVPGTDNEMQPIRTTKLVDDATRLFSFINLGGGGSVDE